MEVRAIFGPPGTGKTRTMVEYVGQEAKQKGGALYLSFTKAAAAEATSRLEVAEYLSVSTIHSMAFNALRMNRAAVVDRKKLIEFGRVSGYRFMGAEKGSDEPQEGDEYLNVIEYAANRKLDNMGAYYDFGCPGTRTRFEAFIDEYDRWKSAYGYMDFNDMLYRYIKKAPEAVPYRVVFLDEAQDCSDLQWEAFAVACRGAQRVYIAGDDDQAIYEWSGANPHGMVEFVQRHGGKTRILDQSYRVPPRVAVMANALIGEVENRVDKEWKPRPGKSGPITEYGDFWNVDMVKFANSGGLILARDKWRIDEIRRALNRDMIPYDQLGGGSPWTSKIAQALRKGEPVEIPAWWQQFYKQADLTLPIKVTLSTIHQAKGREADRVLIDLSMPTRAQADLDRNPDAERRVWYVALTRVKQELLLCGNNPLL